jgi:hypothetical protein
MDRGLTRGKDFKIVYACGHELMTWRQAGVSDHLTCSCTSCHPEPVHRSPFKCKACDPTHNGAFYILHDIGGMSCCAGPEVVDWHCKMELRKKGHLPWHKAVPAVWAPSWGPRKGETIYGLRIDCYKKHGSFSLEAGKDKVCDFCDQPIEDQAME